jgi:hypothetical protein
MNLTVTRTSIPVAASFRKMESDFAPPTALARAECAAHAVLR